MTQCRHLEDMAGTQRQPYLLQWAIPALTGAVLVVNARMASSLQLGRAALDQGRRCGSGFGLPSWQAQCRESLHH
jgi:hypothetical protein